MMVEQGFQTLEAALCGCGIGLSRGGLVLGGAQLQRTMLCGVAAFDEGAEGSSQWSRSHRNIVVLCSHRKLPSRIIQGGMIERSTAEIPFGERTMNFCAVE